MMSPVLMRVRSELRSTRWGSIGLVLLIGLSGAIVLAAAAGARRTETAFPRLVATTNASDALVSPFASDAGPFSALVERQPQVLQAAPLVACYGLIKHVPAGTIPDLTSTPVYTLGAGTDPRFLSAIDRPKLLSGRLPDPARPYEALGNRFLAQRLGITAGARVALDLAIPPQDESAAPDEGTLIPLQFTITGIAVFADDVVPSASLSAEPTLFATPAFWRAHASVSDCGGVVVKLRTGVSVGAFRVVVEELGEKHPDISGGIVLVSDYHARNAKAVRAIQPQAFALWLFAGLAGLSAIVILGQLLARQVSLDALEHPALRAMGMSRSQLFAVAMMRTTVVCVAGAAIAAAIAAGASPLSPIGPARLAEPKPGFELNLLIVVGGAFAFAIVLLAVVALPAWRSAGIASGREEESRRSRLARAAADSRLPAPAAVGVSMALEPGRGRSAVPVRTALTGASIAIASVVAAVVFASSLANLIATPRLFGWTWDALFDTGFGALPASTADTVASLPGVEALAAGHYSDVTIRRKGIPAIGIQLFKGELYTRIVQGRPARASDEIVLGTTAASELRLDVGDRVQVRSASFGGGFGTSTNAQPVRSMRVVGIGVFPALGRGSFVPTSLGEGAAMAAEAMPGEGGTETFAYLMVRYASGVDATLMKRRIEQLIRTLPDCRDNPCDLVRTPRRPADITNYVPVQRTPLVLAGALALLAVATLAHALGTAVRRRRRDLAVLKTLGFVRRQVSTLVAWQASTVAVISSFVGIPMGIAAGRWAWRTFANQLGVPSPSVEHALVIAAVPAIALFVANGLAAIPARAARRTRPALVLRSE
jgi:ABC-type lipoprotein release transport system permease subunit